MDKLRIDRLNKELILNATVVSAILTLVLARIGASVSVDSSDISNSADWPLSFMIYTLLLFAYHGLLSIVNYVIGRFVERLFWRLVIFNIVSLLLLALACYVIEEAGLFSIYVSVIVFSIVAIVMNGKKIKHKLS